MTNPCQNAAAECHQAAQQLEVAAAHLSTAAQHLQSGEIPRYAAHLLATRGHLLNVGHTLDGLAALHAAHSVPLVGEGERT